MDLCSREEEEDDAGERRRHWEFSEFNLSSSIEDLEKKLEEKIQPSICSCVVFSDFWVWVQVFEKWDLGYEKEG